MTQIKQSGGTRKPRVSKSDWLKMALDVLEEGGINAVRVEHLASRLNVAKSGFYYHFRDREDLCDKLLDHWLTLDGTPFFKERMREEASPVERLRTISEVVDRVGLSRYDTAIRQWSRRDPKVRRIWKAEMLKRLAHIRGLFAELGFEGDDLEVRTRTYVAYQVSDRDIFGDLSHKERSKLRELRIDLLTSPN
ncbi:TetR/AcrR family transcriptional regulator [Primorskyibacter sp. S87]|uniref:TetR/AcrR family transcriptional regulator n=1 Tax=Primorskyibacter sp. S87 TaxID=3415126 RepID=UPI003C7E3DCF